METLANIVFERTPQGAVAIKSTGNEVPRRLRTLLLAIDGRSPVSQYVPFLTAFAPLSEKFAELEGLGYLQRKRSSGLDAKTPEVAFVPIQEADLRALESRSLAAQKNSSVNSFELELQALARQMSGGVATAAPVAPEPTCLKAEAHAFTPTRALSSPPPCPSSSLATPELSDLLREMERFLSQSAGAEALPVVLMLEQIKTVSQFRAELPGYLELVQRYGPEADQHIERLARLLDQTGY